MAKQGRITDAVEILRRRYIDGDPDMEDLYDATKLNMTIGQQIFDLRKEADLTQKELADLIGTSPSVICRLEDADYNGYSTNTLRRIARALNRELTVLFTEPSKAKEQTGGVKKALAAVKEEATAKVKLADENVGTGSAVPKGRELPKSDVLAGRVTKPRQPGEKRRRARKPAPSPAESPMRQSD